MINKETGWIKLHRKMLDWEWYSDSNVVRVFLHCLLKANHTEKSWQGETIARGEFITGLEVLSTEISLSTQQIRTALNKLEKTGEINRQSTNKGTRLRVCNYDTYQDTFEDSNKRITNQQQTDNKRITTTKNDNNYKNEKNFDSFWDLYDKKIERKKCESKWDRLPESEREVILKFIPVYKKSEPNLKFRKNPYTFLNSEIWKDDWNAYIQETVTKNPYKQIK